MRTNGTGPISSRHTSRAASSVEEASGGNEENLGLQKDFPVATFCVANNTPCRPDLTHDIGANRCDERSGNGLPKHAKRIRIS